MGLLAARLSGYQAIACKSQGIDQWNGTCALWTSIDYVHINGHLCICNAVLLAEVACGTAHEYVPSKANSSQNWCPGPPVRCHQRFATNEATEPCPTGMQLT